MNQPMPPHQPVLLAEAIKGLALKNDGIYVDATFGRGGHSNAILKQLSAEARLIVIDKDKEAIAYGEQQLNTDKRVTLIHDSFSNLNAIAKAIHVDGLIDGILLDLGVSSPQLDNANRGFSFLHAGPLDMRMNTDEPNDAAHFVNHGSLDELVWVFRTYGEERYAGRIAKAIINARMQQPIITTILLADIVKAAHPRWEKHKHPATRVFQAIRIHVNAELSDLNSGLDAALASLAVGGRLVVISFHSLEDRIVKQFMRDKEQGLQIPINIPIKGRGFGSCFKRIGRAIKPTSDEIARNYRARSAILRIGEKTI